MKEFYPVFSFLLGFVLARFLSAPHWLPHWLGKRNPRSIPPPSKPRPLSFRIKPND